MRWLLVNTTYTYKALLTNELFANKDAFSQLVSQHELVQIPKQFRNFLL